MASLLMRVRPDVKLLANQLLACMEAISEHCILVDNMMGEGHEAANRKGIREALDWVRQGHLLIVFPAARSPVGAVITSASQIRSGTATWRASPA